MHRLRSILPLLLAVLAGPALAESPSTVGRVGLGLSLNAPALIGFGGSDSLFLPIGMMNLHVPIRIGTSLRLEPEVGLYRDSSTATGEEDFDPETGDPITVDSSSTTSILRVGTGLAWAWEPEERVSLYAGPKFGLLRFSSESTVTSGSTERKSGRTMLDLWFGLAAGGEYFFVRSLSLGGEVQLNYVMIGEPEYTGDRADAGNGNGSTDSSLLTTNGLIFVRWYYR